MKRSKIILGLLLSLQMLQADNWRIYDNTPTGAKIEQVDDNEKGKVVKLAGDGLENGYALAGMNETEKRTIEWSMNYNENFEIFISLNTKNGHRFLIYNPLDYNTKSSYGLGSKVTDGTWRTFSRDLEADLSNIDADNKIISVNGFFIRGSGLVANITMKDNQNREDENNQNREDENNNWRIYDNTPTGAKIEQVDDNEKGKVVKLAGDGLENGYALAGMNETEKRTIEWSMNYNENFEIFISLNTKNGHRFLIYNPLDYNTKSSYGLGSDVTDGTWRTFSRV